MKTMRMGGVTMFGAVALLAGCATTSGRSEGSVAAESKHQHGMGMKGDMCPMQVAGATARSEDLEGGIAVAFTTNTGDVAELRQRVKAMAEMHNNHHAEGGMMSGMMVPAATSVADDVPGGARIALTPKDPSQVEALRQHVRTHAERMARGECPMKMMAAERAPAVNAAAEKAMGQECQSMKLQKEKMKEQATTQAAALTDIVAKMNAAPKDKKPGVTAEAVTMVVEQKLEMDARMAKKDEEMMKHMMKHLQLGEESMAKCPMMKKSGDLANGPGSEHARGGM